MERISPPLTGDERETLRTFLDYHRATLAWKCEGLTDEQLRRASMPPSTLSLLGLVRHMAEVERHWFRRVLDGQDLPHRWSDTHDFQAAYDACGSSREEAFTAWEDEVAHARRIEAAAESLDVTAYVPSWEEEASLRLVMLHLIHEYARHNGHADFLREGIDGTTGAWGCLVGQGGLAVALRSALTDKTLPDKSLNSENHPSGCVRQGAALASDGGGESLSSRSGPGTRAPVAGTRPRALGAVPGGSGTSRYRAARRSRRAGASHAHVDPYRRCPQRPDPRTRWRGLRGPRRPRGRLGLHQPGRAGTAGRRGPGIGPSGVFRRVLR